MPFRPDSFKPDVSGYTGAPDLPLETGAGDVSDKTVSALWRLVGPAAAAVLGPAGLAPSLATNFAAGAGSSALGDVAEGKDVGVDKAVVSGGTNAGIGAAVRPLGALLGVLGTKTGLKPPISGDLDLSKLKGMAGEAVAAKGLVKPQSASAAETIDEMLTASGGTVPINASGFKPSAELIRKGIPYKQSPGGKQMYGQFRQAAKEQAPEYDKLLQQYRSMHALTDMPSLKEILAAGVAGGGGVLGQGWPGLAAVLAPRLLNSSRFAPAAPGLQTGGNALLEALRQ